MSVQIVDGTGNANTAKVTTKNQVSVASDAMSRAGRASFDGTLHKLTSGAIALTTTASYSGLFYIINTDPRPIYIWHIDLVCTVNALWKMNKNPTAGTLITSGTAVTATNANFANTTALAATTKKGADAQTITDGTDFDFLGSAAYSAEDHINGTPIILGNSNALAVLCKPSASGDAHVSLTVSQETLDL